MFSDRQLKAGASVLWPVNCETAENIA